MASAELSLRVEKVVGYPPLCDLDPDQRREFHEALPGAHEEAAGMLDAFLARAAEVEAEAVPGPQTGPQLTQAQAQSELERNR